MGSSRELRALLILFGVTQAAIGILMWVAPGTFFDDIGPFGTRNDHYLGDLATFYIALGAAGLVAVRRPAWRVPVLALAALEYVLHALNHLLDVNEAHPHANGPATLVAVAAGGVVVGWMLWLAVREAGA